MALSALGCRRGEDLHWGFPTKTNTIGSRDTYVQRVGNIFLDNANVIKIGNESGSSLQSQTETKFVTVKIDSKQGHPSMKAVRPGAPEMETMEHWL